MPVKSVQWLPRCAVQSASLSHSWLCVHDTAPLVAKEPSKEHESTYVMSMLSVRSSPAEIFTLKVASRAVPGMAQPESPHGACS